jgi:hypothetical protein
MDKPDSLGMRIVGLTTPPQNISTFVMNHEVLFRLVI